MSVDYKYILFNIKNDKLSIFCILTHRYGKHIKSQSMKDLWTFVIWHLNYFEKKLNENSWILMKGNL
jgi:hypothetical protein